MNAIGVHAQGEIDIVIDDQQSLISPAQVAQGQCAGSAAAMIIVLVPILDQPGTADQSRLDASFEPARGLP